MVIIIQFFTKSVDEVDYIMGKMFPELETQCQTKGVPLDNLLRAVGSHAGRMLEEQSEGRRGENPQTIKEIVDAGPEAETTKQIGERAKEIIREWRENGGTPEFDLGNSYDTPTALEGGDGWVDTFCCLSDPNWVGSETEM